MPVTLENLVAGELVSARRSKISANFAAILAWITGAESAGMVKAYGSGIALPAANEGLIWHADYASVMSWRTIGAYTGYASLELGKVAYFDAGSAPPGWLICNGQTTSAATFAALNAFRGSSTLRDLRGEFIRGLDLGRGADAGRTLGSFQSHAIQNHEHTIATEYQQAGTGANGTMYAGVNGTTANPSPKATIGIVAGANVATETRPRNIALLPCIKF